MEKLKVRELFRKSMSFYVVLALLMPKKHGTWKIYIDNIAINKIIIKYQFLISRLDVVQICTIDSKQVHIFNFLFIFKKAINFFSSSSSSNVLSPHVPSSVFLALCYRSWGSRILEGLVYLLQIRFGLYTKKVIKTCNDAF